MKRIFQTFFYLIWFAVPAMIVQYYHHNISPMSPEDIRLATIGGTLGVIIMAVLTGFARPRKPSIVSTVSKIKIPKGSTKKTRIVRDPATGAERLFNWNEKDGVWESDDGLSILDDSKTEEWERQRLSDREWNRKQTDKLRTRQTSFDKDMDKWNAKQKKDLKEMEKQMERSRKFGERHGKYDLTDKEMKDYLSSKQTKDEIEGAEWEAYGDEYDKITNRLEWAQWGADFGMDIVDVLTLGTGKPIKYIYFANRNLVGELTDGLLKKRSLSSIVVRTVTKTTIDITQDSVNKIGYKYAANGVGDGIKQAIADADEGKSATKGFVSGFTKGITRTGIEHGISNTKFKWNSKQNEIAQKATKRSSELLGKQQAGQISEKLSTTLRNNIRTRAAQDIAAETTKNKGLLSTGLGKLSDGIIGKIMD